MNAHLQAQALMLDARRQGRSSPRACGSPPQWRVRRLEGRHHGIADGLHHGPSLGGNDLTDALERVEAWPPHIQNELAEFALELDAGLKDGKFQPTAEEPAGIDRGLRAAAEGRFATDQQVEAAFAKFGAAV